MADEFAKLKKPTVSAWVVNQLVRTRELDVQRLLKAGEALEQAQREILRGKSANFDSARQEEAAAVTLLRAAASDVLPSITLATLDRVTQTLRSATSAESRARLKTGRLTDDLAPPGFEAFAALPPEGRKLSPKRDKAPPENPLGILTTQKREATVTASRLAREAVELEKAAGEAELAARKARQRADAARQQAADAAEETNRLTTEINRLKKGK